MSFRAVTSWISSSPRCLHALKFNPAQSSPNNATSCYSTSTSVPGIGLQSLEPLKVPSEANKIILPTGKLKESYVEATETAKPPSITKNSVQFSDVIAKLRISNETKKAHILRLQGVEGPKPRPPCKPPSTPSRKKRALNSNLVAKKGARKGHKTSGISSQAPVPLPATQKNGVISTRPPLSSFRRHEKRVAARKYREIGNETWAGDLQGIEGPKPRPPCKPPSTPSRKERALTSNLVTKKSARKAYKTSGISSQAPVPLPATQKIGVVSTRPSLSSFRRHEKRVAARIYREIGNETWAGEPWAQVGETKVVIDRIFPPHDPPLSCIQEGKILGDPGAKVGPILTDVPPVSKHNPVAQLSHGLDRVLFNPGVHWLQDPRSHVYNFTPWLEKIPKVNDFAFERLSGFISSSRDEDLRALATQENKKFAGSTSSLSGMLSHIYFLITEHKEIDCTILSQHFQSEPRTFTPGQTMPAMTMLNYKDGIYAIDSHSAEWDNPDRNVLTWLGTLLENFLTKSPEDFNTFMRFESSVPSVDNQEPILREAYRYAKSDKFVMRSQLDCHDSRLPGTGVFDIKTRACVTVRMDVLNYEENAGYMINRQHGILQSFEKEYYDLIRSAFLKYSFQVRIGNMDGVLVAYHNTERIFGFQYISLDEMDERLLGATPGIGDKLFNHSIKLLEAILEEASACFPGQSVLCVFETPKPGKYLDVFVQPEWSGTEDTRPTKQLRVVIAHELDGVHARTETALSSTNQKWDIQYTVSNMDGPASSIRESLNNVLLRKKRSFVLPSSVPLEEAEKYWQNLSFSKNSTSAKPFNPDLFILAEGSVERFRRLAREGRVELQQKELLLAGRPKIVYGQGIYEPIQIPAEETSLTQTDGGNIETEPSPK